LKVENNKKPDNTEPQKYERLLTEEEHDRETRANEK